MRRTGTKDCSWSQVDTARHATFNLLSECTKGSWKCYLLCIHRQQNGRHNLKGNKIYHNQTSEIDTSHKQQYRHSTRKEGGGRKEVLDTGKKDTKKYIKRRRNERHTMKCRICLKVVAPIGA